jgi:hypothetical protein
MELLLLTVSQEVFDQLSGEYKIDDDGLKRDPKTNKLITGDKLLDKISSNEDFEKMLEQLQTTVEKATNK